MKKCRHAHVVRLYEVIDDKLQNKIYMGASASLAQDLLYPMAEAVLLTQVTFQ